MADFDAQLPVRTTPAQSVVGIANVLQATINPAEDYPQGSSTAGQNGVLAQGAVTTNPPTYTPGQTSPLSLDAKGNLRTVVDQSEDVTPVFTFFTDAAVASGGTTTHSIAGPVSLDRIYASASGELKIVIAIGVTGSEVTYFTGFTSASNQNIMFDSKYPYVIPTGSSVKITLKNRDTVAQDLYLTFETH